MLPSTPRRPSREEQTQRSPTSNPPSTPTPRSITRRRTKGLFQDGTWFCDCFPREACACLQAQRNPKTRGNYFYRCAASEGCGFFLWKDDAMLRENVPVERDENVVPPPADATPFKQLPITSFGFSITPRSREILPEIHEGATTIILDDEGEDAEGSADDNGVAAASTPCPASRKRKRDAFQDEDPFEEMTPDEERQLAAFADQRLPSADSHLPPPRQSEQDVAPPAPGVSVTPAITRTVDRVGGLATPVERRLWPDDNPQPSKRQKTVSFEDHPDAGVANLASPFSVSATTSTAVDSTQTPTRSSNPTKTPTSSTTTTMASPRTAITAAESPLASGGPDDVDAMEQVMTLLESHRPSLDPDILASVHTILKTSVLKTKGIIQSRDNVRSMLRERDLKIGKQDEKITHLENIYRLAQNKISAIKADIMNIYQRN